MLLEFRVLGKHLIMELETKYFLAFILKTLNMVAFNFIELILGPRIPLLSFLLVLRSDCEVIRVSIT